MTQIDNKRPPIVTPPKRGLPLVTNARARARVTRARARA
nr:MAG TPA: hypothetical protein [Microviridae sp.]